MSVLYDRISKSVNIKHLLKYYGFQYDKNGFMSCPFHVDKTPSFKIYDKSNSFYCFSCHKGGSIIQFVMMYFHITYSEAISKINSDFNLSILDEPVSYKDIRRDKNIRSLKNISNKRRKMSYESMIDQHCKYHQAILHEEPMSNAFCEALYNIGDLEYKIECAEEGHML